MRQRGEKMNQSKSKIRRKIAMQVILLGCGVAMLCLGIWRGEIDIVLSKAVRLCLECVGIG